MRPREWLTFDGVGLPRSSEARFVSVVDFGHPQGGHLKRCQLLHRIDIAVDQVKRSVCVVRSNKVHGRVNSWSGSECVQLDQQVHELGSGESRAKRALTPVREEA